MKKTEIEMENNIYETVQDLDPKAQVNFKVFKFLLDITCEKSILFLTKNKKQTKVSKQKDSIEHQYFNRVFRKLTKKTFDTSGFGVKFGPKNDTGNHRSKNIYFIKHVSKLSQKFETSARKTFKEI